jgi:putative addiction module component (TIGR02574 family)
VKELETIIRDVLELPLDERARLAGRLLESLDDLSEEEIERLWLDEAERRVAAHRAGEMESYPAEEVHQEILGRLK